MTGTRLEWKYTGPKNPAGENRTINTEANFELSKRMLTRNSETLFTLQSEMFRDHDLRVKSALWRAALAARIASCEWMQFILPVRSGRASLNITLRTNTSAVTTVSGTASVVHFIAISGNVKRCNAKGCALKDPSSGRAPETSE